MPSTGKGADQFPGNEVPHEQPGIVWPPIHLLDDFVDTLVSAIAHAPTPYQDVDHFAFYGDPNPT